MSSHCLTTEVSFIVADLVISLVVLWLPQVLPQATIDPTTSVNSTFDSGMDASLRQLLVDLHNEYRREEMEAANMNKLDWSPYLEQEAAKFVTACEFKHQDNPSWGENLFRSTDIASPDNTVSNALNAWVLERHTFLPGSGTIYCCDGKKMTCCHYTQMVWATSEYLGCALTRCPTLQGETDVFDYKDAWFFACYYYPPGNVLNQQPYLSGRDQCTACSAANPDCDRGLCYFDGSRC